MKRAPSSTGMWKSAPCSPLVERMTRVWDENPIGSAYFVLLTNVLMKRAPTRWEPETVYQVGWALILGDLEQPELEHHQSLVPWGFLCTLSLDLEKVPFLWNPAVATIYARVPPDASLQ
ncbi:hypothetical protein DL546_005916 [Coniochaeta pulveracea]|uniref:Uncharacterized protein n=1 Tax=Coniochaeta pulveracea TaxID=177199 RepID=A0A420YJC9_9PEZI|nr:hypothetical protein DL546_005916 [Coniochaeta pulveracea]